MSTESLINLGVAQLSELLKKREISSVELTKEYLKRIENNDGDIGAFLTVTADYAVKRADIADKIIAESDSFSALCGIPFAMKDNICTKGITTTCASRMLENFIPAYNANVTELLNAHNAVMLGKVNMDEFAMGSTTENSAFKITHNPRNLQYVPGGSSGGSAAAVAANEAVFAIGSDTGGSIRQPAAYCGVVGMKPTYGTVSRFGLVAFASSLDQIGPLTKNVEDCALVLQSITGHDERDSTSVKCESDYTSDLKSGVKGLKIALPKEYFSDGISPEVKAAVLNAATLLEKEGAVVEESSLPTLKHTLAAYYILCCAEASSNLARFDGVRYGFRAENCSDIESLYRTTRTNGFGKEVKRRIMLGNFVLSAGYYDAYYKKAQQVRTLVINDFKSIFDNFDVILSPVVPNTAYKLGERRDNPLEMYMGDIYTVPVNIAGLPAISMPCGNAENGLPIGLQIIGKTFDEKTVLRTAYAYERIRDGESK